MKEQKSHKIAINCLAIAALLVFFCSCISFNIADWPSRYVYPNNTSTFNWCGTAGAFCSYYLIYYIGPGVMILLLSCISLLIAKLARFKISQPILRSIGALFLTVSGSATFYCLWPNAFYSFPIGSGGILGVGTKMFLSQHFATLGTALLISSIWIVGTVLLADSLVLILLHGIGFGLKKTFGFALPAAKTSHSTIQEIFQNLRAKQTPKLAKPRTLSINNDAHIESVTEKATVQRQSPDKDQIPDKPQVAAAGNNQTQTSLPRSSDLKVTSANIQADRIEYIPKSYEDYKLPPLDLLAEPEYNYSAIQEKVVKAKAAALESLLSEFNINAHVVAADTGPVVTMFELELAAGVKVCQISSLTNDIARALGAGAVRIVAPLPGKHTIGIEVPNSEKEKVRIKDILGLSGEKQDKMAIPLFLGKDSSGSALVADLASMPHLLIAGTTGSGKSVCINTIITSILLTKRPDEVKMILVDPKMVEMTAFNTVPHLMSPIVTETQRAVQILEWATVKMDERYCLLAEARVKNIAGYNKLTQEEIIERFDPTSPEEEAKIPKKLPYIVIVIDELADLMMTAAKEIEFYIVRLAQKSRAVGIHIVLATQRPQATVVTGLIKSNMPCRIGFRVAARMDSRIILDQNGAEALLGQGDMLFLKPGTSELIRAQGAFLDDSEISKIVKHLKEIAEPQFHPELTQLGRIDTSEMSRDDLFDDAVKIVLESKRGSVSLLQRRLSIGYARASRIIEMMAASGILGEYKGSQAREVTMTLKEYEVLRQQMQADAANGYADMQEDGQQTQPTTTEPTYLTEGQKEYVAIEADEELSTIE